MRSLILGLLATVAIAAEPAAKPRPLLAPEALGSTVMTAGAPAQLPLRGTAGAVLRWRLSGWDGAEEARGEATAGADGIALVVLTPAAGWHQLALDGGGVLGLVALDPALERGRDPFFALDCAMAWLTREAGKRAGMVDLLARLGLTTVRERLQWQGFQPTPDGFKERTGFDDDALRALYAAKGLDLLEAFHDAPQWLGRVSGAYPADLVASAGAWHALVRRFAATTAALEVWNEPDAPEFSNGGTADQLVALTRAVAWGARSAKPEVLIGGGVMTSIKPGAPFSDVCFAGGLIQASDAFTYHDYGDPETLPVRLADLEQRLAKAGVAGVPVWITEAGKPWPKGTDLPAAADDALSAQWITMRAVEARAGGVARHYAFVFPFYDEGRNNFGMTARDGSPLRSLAAYAHVARRLGGLAYCGDLAVAGAKRARVFAGGDRLVASVWMGAPDPATAVPVAGLPVVGAFGLDGRALPVVDGAVRAPEGACLLELAPAARAQVVAGRPVLTQDPGRARPKPHPLVLQVIPEPGQLSSRLTRYEVARQPGGGPARLRVRLNHLGGAARGVTLTLMPPADGAVVDGADRTVSVGGPGWTETDWRIQVASAGTWRIEGRDASGPIPPAIIILDPEIDGAALLQRIPAERRRRIPTEAVLAASSNVAPGCELVVSRTDEEAVRLHLDFSKNRAALPWAFPRIALGGTPRFETFDALLVRMRCTGQVGVRFFAFEQVTEGRGNIGYLSDSPVCEADGAWHWVLLPLAELRHCGSTDRDPNGRLDRELIDRISIGVNGYAKVVDLDLAHLELVHLADAAPR